MFLQDCCRHQSHFKYQVLPKIERHEKPEYLNLAFGFINEFLKALIIVPDFQEILGILFDYASFIFAFFSWWLGFVIATFWIEFEDLLLREIALIQKIMIDQG